MTVAELARVAAGGTAPAGLAAVSFDDGMQNNLTTALPILHSLGIPASVYVPSGWLGGRSPWLADGADNRILSADEVRALAHAGWEIGAHTVTHADLSVLDYAQCRDEIERSCADLSEMTGRRVETFAYPFGRYSPVAVQAARDCGLIAAVTSARGAGTRSSCRGRWSAPPIPIRSCCSRCSISTSRCCDRSRSVASGRGASGSALNRWRRRDTPASIPAELTRVLLVHQPVDGGVARHVADLCTGLAARGLEPVLCGPDLPVTLRGRGAAGDHQPLALQRSVSPGPDAAAARRLAAIVRRVRPDVIHAHSSKAGAVARVARVAHPRRPVIYTPHGYAMAGFFERELERTAYREAERGLGLLTTRVIAVCEAEAALARTVTLSRRVRTVHNGFDPPGPGDADPRVMAVRGRGPVVAAVSQLRAGKGIETLLEAWPAVAANHPAAQLVIAGGGALHDRFVSTIHALGIGASVHLLGEHPDPIAVLRGADAFVLSSWAEAFPYAILEAMTLGLPIVATDVGGIGEAITSGSDGILVPARAAGALGVALAGLLGDPAQRQRLGAAALATVTRRFGVAAMVDGVIGVYDEALGRR